MGAGNRGLPVRIREGLNYLLDRTISIVSVRDLAGHSLLPVSQQVAIVIIPGMESGIIVLEIIRSHFPYQTALAEQEFEATAPGRQFPQSFVLLQHVTGIAQEIFQEIIGKDSQGQLSGVVTSADLGVNGIRRCCLMSSL